MLKTLSLLLCSLAFVLTTAAQDSDGYRSSSEGEAALGLGLGLPYGGFGVRFGLNITDNLNAFGGFGYQVAGVGYNLGIKKDFASARQSQFYLSAMFGTNAAIKVKGLSAYDKTYSGPSFGAGVKINSRKKEGRYWDLGLIVPITSSSFKDAEDRVKNDPRVDNFRSASPILLVVGYNFGL